MQTRRIALVVDSSAPLDEIDAARVSWHEWASANDIAVSIGVVAFGSAASWLPDSQAQLVGSSALKAAATSDHPRLAAALTTASAGPRTHALLTVLSREPAPGWEASLAIAAFSFRACVSTARDPVAAIGSGYLGANFRADHLGLAMRWLTRELCDRTFWCECGRMLVYDAGTPTCECGQGPAIPPRLRIRGRVVLLVPGAKLYPHHLGRPLEFEKPVVRLDDLPRADGTVEIDGVRAEIRTQPPSTNAKRRAGRFRGTPIVAKKHQCSACDRELVAPVLHRAPDPRRYCGRCVGAGLVCDFCEAPVVSTVRTAWPDGRKACRECWATSVTDIAELHGIVEMSRAWLVRRLGMTFGACPVEFEHAAEIARMNGRVFQPSPGYTPRPLGFYRKPLNGAQASVFIEHGTPLDYLYGVVTHELVHAWQWENWPHEVARPLIEGLAMWVEYQSLLDAGAIHAARQPEMYGDETYGLGFRIALAVEKECGFDQVKNRLHLVTSVSVSGPG